MKLLDLFCGQGGAGMGYHRAGFDVYAVDIDPQPRNPFPFYQGNAFEVLRRLTAGEVVPFVHPDGRVEDLGIDVVGANHGSPPCQASTTMSAKHRGKGTKADEHVNRISETREALQATGLPYILENVPGARKSMKDPVILHGGMFDLGVDRPRLFETNWPVTVHWADRAEDPIGVYGKAPDGRRLWTRKDGTELRAASSVEEASVAMGIYWMDWRGLCEAVPPIYTKYLGLQLIKATREAA